MLRAAEVSAHLEGTREEFFSILSDYGRYSGWVPNVELSGVLAREGDVTVAEFRGRRFSDRTFNLELIPFSTRLHRLSPDRQFESSRDFGGDGRSERPSPSSVPRRSWCA